MKIWVISDTRSGMGKRIFDNERDALLFASAYHKPMVQAMDVPDDYVSYIIVEYDKDGSEDNYCFDRGGVVWSDVPSKELADETIDAMTDSTFALPERTYMVQLSVLTVD